MNGALRKNAAGKDASVVHLEAESEIRNAKNGALQRKRSMQLANKVCSIRPHIVARESVPAAHCTCLMVTETSYTRLLPGRSRRSRLQCSSVCN